MTWTRGLVWRPDEFSSAHVSRNSESVTPAFENVYGIYTAKTSFTFRPRAPLPEQAFSKQHHSICSFSWESRLGAWRRTPYLLCRTQLRSTSPQHVSSPWEAEDINCILTVPPNVLGCCKTRGCMRQTIRGKSIISVLCTDRKNNCRMLNN